MPPRRAAPPASKRTVSLATAAWWLAAAVGVSVGVATALARHRLAAFQAAVNGGRGGAGAGAPAGAVTPVESTLGDLLVGRRDWALASAGGRVVAHSRLAPGVVVGGGNGEAGPPAAWWQRQRRQQQATHPAVHPLASRWLLTPPPGGVPLPGRCLPLAGASGGFVELRLRSAGGVASASASASSSSSAAAQAPPVVSAITLEAPPPDLAFPEGANALPAVLAVSLSADGGRTWADAGEAAYHTPDVPRLGGHLAQTGRLATPGPATDVRLVVVANHGHPDCTCLHRVRVHAE